MDKDKKELLQRQSAKYIADLFKNHGINCSIEENKLLFEKEQISIETYCFAKSSNPNLSLLQLDVFINYGVNPVLESFAGFGKDLDTANINAFENFTNNSFHTILAAFFTSNYDDEIQKYDLSINGKNFEVFASNIGIRGAKPKNLTTEWHSQFEADIQKLPLEEGTHWIRLFYAQDQNKTTVCEVLLNNEPCVPILQKAKNFNWYSREEFYSLRVFMILKNGIDYGRVIKLIGSELEYDEVFSSLESMGLSELEIQKAYAFMPEAFGRKLIQEMDGKGNFSNQSIIINDAKEQFDIDLNNEKMYVKATQLAIELTKEGWNDELKSIAFMSASFNTLNESLKSGVKLEEIDCYSFSTAFYIPSYPEAKPKKEKKPFWKFW